MRETTHAGHCREIARDADLSSFDVLVVCGGDGTLHEACDGMLRRAPGAVRPPIALIPGGTGNSVMCDLGTWDPAEAARRVIEGRTVRVDAARVRDGSGALDAYSVNVCAWGVVGDVGVIAERARCLGAARYDVCAIWTLLKKVFSTVKVEATLADGARVTREGPMLTGFANNTQFFGKGLRAAPHARLDDGLVDLVLARAGSRAEMLAVFLQLATGAHQRTPLAEFLQVHAEREREREREAD